MAEQVNEWLFAGVAFEAFGDRILVIEDEFRSGYECKTCSGAGKLKCPYCGGSGASKLVPHARCGKCEGTSWLTCSDCNGKGGTLVVPEIAQRRPTTGEIVSVGANVQHLKVGDSVMYGSFTGHVSELEAQNGEKVVLRTLHEAEILAKVKGHLEYRADRGNQPAPKAMGV
jgi:co-chaperonin GroES (HSP10)